MSIIPMTSMYLYNYHEKTKEVPTGWILFSDNSDRQRPSAQCMAKYCPMCGRDLEVNIKDQEMGTRCAICEKPIEKREAKGMYICKSCLKTIRYKMNISDSSPYMAGPGPF